MTRMPRVTGDKVVRSLRKAAFTAYGNEEVVQAILAKPA